MKHLSHIVSHTPSGEGDAIYIRNDYFRDTTTTWTAAIGDAFVFTTREQLEWNIERFSMDTEDFGFGVIFTDMPNIEELVNL